MVNEVILNDVPIKVINYRKDIQGESVKILFDFHVSSEDYHRITTLLYQMNFDVEIPEENWMFRGSITNYYTSFTNLYLEGQVGVFHLEIKKDV
ncbi:DUF3219 family protein [Halalkalibacter akibai]|uniref:DUF3219 domain-containing protein n=1 Tax=Halalkalibacter akibai (strain ATCC 43226 / DSM 21942 / CIP 109018 / JCM 9157 / 1139) TaxID=1236973 RepID=W4QVQ9_HALA3|nr:DUF3219 family protein [Halalkalibacter akibai]GAE35967.1 hypothetical protein JCM9157_3110 [Halalkalibacter akibai JCM 9157]